MTSARRYATGEPDPERGRSAGPGRRRSRSPG